MKLKLIEIKPELADVTTLVFKPESDVVWQAGQFYHYVLHHRPTDDRGSDRWFTVASAPYEKVIKITTRFNSEKSSTFKTSLNNLKVGHNIEVSELEGDFVVEDSSKEFVFIAGGIGITPFRSILKDLEYNKKNINVILIYANRDKNIVFKDELEEIAKNHPTLKIHYIISPDKINEEKIKEIVPDFNDKVFYVSGPELMVDGLGSLLVNMGLNKEQLKQDWFPGYEES